MSSEGPLPDKWNDAQPRRALGAGAAALSLEPARLGPPHHELRRRQHLGQGGGEGPPDRRGGRVLYVKGSGRRPRLHEDGRLLHALHRQAGVAEEALSRPRPRGRDGRILPPLLLQPEPPRHLASTPRPTASSPTATSTTCTRTRSSPSPRPGTGSGSPASASATDRLDPLAAAGLRPRPQGRKDGGGEPQARGPDPRQPRARDLGRDLEGDATRSRCA